MSQSFEHVRAHILQPDTLWQIFFHQFVRSLRKQDLPTMSNGHETSSPVYGRAVKVALTILGRSCVKTDADH